MRQEIIEPLLVFCTHGIRMRDTRCCGMILRLFISLVPEFQGGQGQVRSKQPGPAATTSTEANEASRANTSTSQADSHCMIPVEISSIVREYIASDVLKACLNSFHEPYFVEVQKELASLIAAIVVNYGSTTTTPQRILLSVPHVSTEKFEKLRPFMSKPESHPRQQRALVLDLLKDLKGVSVSEMGKLAKVASTGGFAGSSARSKRSNRSKMAQGFMDAAPASSLSTGNAEVVTTRSDHLHHDNNNGIPGGGGGGRTTPEALEGVSHLFEG